MHRACSIAIVGGGIGGLSCACKLLQLLPNAQASVIDMGRSGPGGRASTRRREELQFDHGCQFVRVDPTVGATDAARRDLADQMQLWQKEGAIAEWDSSHLGLLDAQASRFTPRSGLSANHAHQQTSPSGFCQLLAPGDIFVGSPSMDALCTSLAAQHGHRLKRVCDTKVRQLEEDGSGAFTLSGTTGGPDGQSSTLGTFDAVVLSDAMAGRSGSPGHITSASGNVNQLLVELGSKQAAPRLTLMAAFPAGTVAAPFDAATVSGSDAIEWLSNDSAKPGRSEDAAQCWTAVSTEAYARRAIEQGLPLQRDGRYHQPDEAAMATVTSEMLDQVAQLLAPFAAGGADNLTKPLHASAQRWGSALYPAGADDPGKALLAAPGGRVVAVGDCLAGSEAARVVAQAHATARALAATLADG